MPTDARRIAPTALRTGRIACAVAAAALACAPTAHGTADAATPRSNADRCLWVTLGTNGGPVPSASRSQPANLLRAEGKVYLVDAGAGVESQLAKLDMQVKDIDAVFISHLHFDHTAGLAAVLGLRWQTNSRQALRIYGPPGTASMVDGILRSMIPGATAGYGVPGSPFRDPMMEAVVVELKDGDIRRIDSMQVSVRSNTHYTDVGFAAKGSAPQSLSFRFELPGRSVAYTGDTGPSSAVAELAANTDLLVTEMIDADYTIGSLHQASPDLPEAISNMMDTHLRTHHLLAKDVGELAERARVKAVVVTHFVGRDKSDPGHFKYLGEISRVYRGPVEIADDLNCY